MSNTKDYGPPGSSIDGISQASILKGVIIFFSRGSSQPRDQNWVSCTEGCVFTDWVTSEEANALVAFSKTNKKQSQKQGTQIQENKM